MPTDVNPYRATMPSPQIIYVGGFCFPNGSAGGLRVLGIGRALRDAGYRVAFAGVERQGREEDRLPDGGYCYQGFTYVPEKDRGTTRLARLKRGLLTHAIGRTTFQRLHAMNLSAAQAIIAYHASTPLLWQLRSFCRKRRLALVTDCTEWYDPRHVAGGSLGPIRWDSELRMRYMQPKIGRVIAISSFLERYYRDRGCDVVRVPPLVDMNELDSEASRDVPRNDGKLRLVYAGIPGKKDLLANAIRGLCELRASGTPVELHLVGLSRSATESCIGKHSALLNELEDAVVYHGRLPHPTAMALVAEADFSILVRPDERFAHAGFPTKLVESLSMGVPVLANLTSDIGEYVRDGMEGIVLEGSDPNAFAAGVRRALAMPREQWRVMRIHARRQAADCFDYRKYSVPLSGFVERAVNAARSER